MSNPLYGLDCVVYPVEQFSYLEIFEVIGKDVFLKTKISAQYSVIYPLGTGSMKKLGLLEASYCYEECPLF